MDKRVLFFIAIFFSSISAAHAEVAIETAVSRSVLPVGEQLVLDIIVSNADGRIEQPKIGSIEGFTSYSQGHSQELSIINGRTSSRSVYSYVLVANDSGQKMIGPFEVIIAGKEYKVAPVKVEVTQGSSASGQYSWSQSPVTSPPPRALAGESVGDQDIFIKAWLDKDEVYVNEPVMLTYTLFTRLSATYKGFEKEPVTTGFWVEDFPPEKTIRRTEQFLNGQRYVVADVRKLALFPTEAGAFTVEPGTLSATVEIRNDDTFQSFFSNNIFGSRRGGFPSMVTSVVSKILPADSVRIIVKALPEIGKPKDFSGAVGQYQIESSLDKNEVEAGDPVTLRVRIFGKGNINTVQSVKLPKMDNFKVYDSSTSTNISKEKLTVEGERITETVIVPRKPGRYEIPSLSFSYFDPKSQTYRTLKTESMSLTVSGVEESASVSSTPSAGSSAAESIFEPAEKEEVNFVAKDIRFIRTADDGKHVPEKELYRQPLYWAVNGLLLLAAALSVFFSARRATDIRDTKGFRLRRSHGAAKAKLKAASHLLKESDRDAFYVEISKAVHGYFADKFNISPQSVTQERVQELAGELITAELMNKIIKFFHETSMGRFAKVDKAREEMQEVYDLADEVITSFEKVKLK